MAGMKDGFRRAARPLAAAAGLAAVALILVVHFHAKPGSRAPAETADPSFVAPTAASLDPEDYEFVRPVCSPCHKQDMFMHSRSWSEWQDIFKQMSRYGAAGTPEEWEHIYKYFARSLTQLDINHADEDELMAVLGVDEKTAIAIVQRRIDRRFQSPADLEKVPGVDKALIEKMAPRLLIDRPPEDQ
jgi:hypothetical protein